ncbi:MAG: HIT family protein [Candidatus Aenigmarchaeota archaeon]|nr:HIT family protein [Candidatus Aenigmarchaeota archaeon]
MDQCPFCKIVSREIPADIVYEDEFTLAFLDANPSAPGHTLVIPKRHLPTILDVDDETLKRVFQTVKKVTEMIKNALQPDGFNIGINHGEAAGQRVPHLHVHIIPRFNGDKGAMVQMVVRNPPTESLSVIREKIKSYAFEEDSEPEEIEEELEEYEEEKVKEEEKEGEEEKSENDEEEKLLEEMEKILKKMQVPR